MISGCAVSTVLLVAFLWREVGAFVPRIVAAPEIAVQWRACKKTAIFSTHASAEKDEKERKAKVDEVKKNLNLPLWAKIRHKLPSRQKEASRKFREVGNNNALFSILKLLRSGTPAKATSLEAIKFVEKKNLVPTLFYETKRARLFLGLIDNHKLISGFYYQLEDAPQMVFETGTTNYKALYGDKILPAAGRMMLSKDPEDCFLRQTSAFCSPEAAGGRQQRLVCDLDYLKKYELKPDVRTTTPGYGGRAVVENGKIVEISGVRSDDERFPPLKAAFLSSFAVHVVVVCHALITHLAISQRLLVKLTAGRTRACQNAWRRSEGPSLLLRALTYRTNAVSINEQLLIGPGNSLVGRACSLSNDGLMELGIDMYEKYSGMSPDELVAAIGGSGTATWTNACNIAWQGAKDAVNVICKDIQPFLEDTDLSDLALILWASTFYHGFIGDFQLDNVCKGNLLFTLAKSNATGDLSFGTLAASIGVTTMTRTVTMIDLNGLFPKREEVDAWKRYETLLQNIDTGVSGFSLAAPVYTGVNF